MEVHGVQRGRPGLEGQVSQVRKLRQGEETMKIIGIKQLNEFVELHRAYGYDVPVGVSGPEQSGKSTLAMQCSREKLGIGEEGVGSRGR